ncbi:MAG: (d)CMP kinase [Flavobacteriaceae bacterium]|jgi:cytidylate kinase|nr:(d)CMP kinase [Flavobacteriaceae bacterium]MBT5091311.1 (d)CMP kinase [Flavobacteriaceae bacterium]MBT5694455.1 (d)CMP kinase [Flavobacteriaceae bacterium]MBT5975496.1 (d)CMP kinase [Flavobacteriaceae bacterium]MBT7948676.1 (d)CMP kinase [Flavobacteriaceae bacterium]|tara:strand:- start:4449 stop:5126 length:678 start_codon:yes stop_codon:yes gene_type:complete
MKKIIIAIDGFAATGKSTVAKKIANSLGYVYIDTGAMYRSVTYFGQKQNDGEGIDVMQLVDSLSQLKIHFENSEQGQQTFLNDENVTVKIREAKVNNAVSDIASVKEIRDFLVTQQRQMGKDKGIVMDGRDIGTVVFPEAESKFFLTASPEIRAKRRHKEQLEAGNLEPYEAVLENVKARDHQDSTRLINPLRKAESAVEIEVSNLSIDEVYEQMMNQIKGVIGV